MEINTIIFINRIIKSLSYRLSRKLLKFSLPVEYPDYCIKKLLQNLSINLIIDVGANKGQFRDLVRDAGYKNLIISFEPLLDAYKILKKKSVKDKFWIIWENIALGDSIKTERFHKTRNSVSSSIFPPLGIKDSNTSSGKYLKDIEIVDFYDVKVVTLDSIAKSIKEIAKGFYNNLSIHLKIDVEGYEKLVLLGSENFLSDVLSISLELSLQPLNKNASTYDEIVSYLKEKGFSIWSIDRGYTSERGRCYQIDLIFIREELL